uniref:DnaB-like helicase C-terminal domain-containing protein n=1 Tax=Desulfonatronovibrio magnus TaxID=698827 RepID=UPI0005EB271D
QLLNTGIEAMDMGPNETIKISELAVRIKQLARDMNVAVLAISDVTKEEQKGTFQSKEFTMNALRGSNRIAHAADCIMVLYSEPAHADGGKAEKDAWEVFTHKVKDSEQAMDFVTNLKEFKEENPVGGEGATVYARLELIKNRGGQGKGNQFLLFHRAFHKFEPAEIEGQRKAEGRGE